jgi:two-component system LytT family response regulator
MFTRHNLPAVAVSPGFDRLPGSIALRVDRRTVMVDYDEIERIEASNHNAHVHTAAGVHTVSEGLSSLLARLSPNSFARVSRFMAVNLDFVVAFEPRSHGDQILFLRSGTTVVVSRTHRSELLRKLGGFAPLG